MTNYCDDARLRILEFSVVFRGLGLEGNGINRTVLEMGKLYSFPLGLLPLQFFVRLMRLFEVHPDVTSLADRS